MNVGPSRISVSRSSAAFLRRAATNASPVSILPRSRTTRIACPSTLDQIAMLRRTAHSLRSNLLLGAGSTATALAASETNGVVRAAARSSKRSEWCPACCAASRSHSSASASGARCRALLHSQQDARAVGAVM